ncbi:hypothetical protein SDC9_185399 [bioreactor metagenome]|uniref:Uncharacterized protein n=1 Tax=bioreactor metagenome TaxID=1076179 RepID=A0A645HFS5_9ZZZZ
MWRPESRRRCHWGNAVREIASHQSPLRSCRPPQSSGPSGARAASRSPSTTWRPPPAAARWRDVSPAHDCVATSSGQQTLPCGRAPHRSAPGPGPPAPKTRQAHRTHGGAPQSRSTRSRGERSRCAAVRPLPPASIPPGARGRGRHPPPPAHPECR